MLRRPELLASWNRGEDAALWKIDEKRIGILTVDFITPVVDEPARFGEIAAANSLSDVYAMGGRPIIALNVVCFPTSCEPLEVLKQILDGGARKVCEAGAMLAGGHSVQDQEPKYGLVVFGEVESDKMWKVGTARAGDSLILTKPLGTGIAVTAIKAGLFPEEDARTAAASMAKLNSVPPILSDKMRGLITACTDLTGFGLAGHALEMARGAGVTVHIDWARVPLLPGVEPLAAQGFVTGASGRNWAGYGAGVVLAPGLPATAQSLVTDPQTSGGLLVACTSDTVQQVLDTFAQEGFAHAAVVGRVEAGPAQLHVG